MSSSKHKRRTYWRIRKIGVLRYGLYLYKILSQLRGGLFAPYPSTRPFNVLYKKKHVFFLISNDRWVSLDKINFFIINDIIHASIHIIQEYYMVFRFYFVFWMGIYIYIISTTMLKNENNRCIAATTLYKLYIEHISYTLSRPLGKIYTFLICQSKKGWFFCESNIKWPYNGILKSEC